MFDFVASVCPRKIDATAILSGQPVFAYGLFARSGWAE
jgi:hypothetical protein